MAVEVTMSLQERIEYLREKLRHSVDSDLDNLLNQESYQLSRELDELILQAMKEQKKI